MSRAPASPESNKRRAQQDVDRWLREQGMPTLVPWRGWFEDLPRRVAPLVAAVAAVTAATALALLTIAFVYYLGESEGATGLLLIGLIVVLTGVVWAIAWLTLRGVRRMLRGPGTTGKSGLAVAIIVVGGVVYYAVFALLDPTRSFVSISVEVVVVLASCTLIAALGGTALTAWASRLALRNISAIGHMASLAVPVILMLVIFALLSAEVWQVATQMTWSTLWSVAAVIAALEITVVLSVCIAELRELRDGDPSHYQELVHGSPVAGEVERAGTVVRAIPLSWLQRANAVLVVSAAQLIQAALFATLLTTLLCILGGLMVTPDVLFEWLGDDSSQIEPLVIGTVTFPLTTNLLKTATVLAIIASLPFVFSAVSEQRYRNRFFDPIMSDIRRTIAVYEVATATGVWSRQDSPARE